MSGPSHTAQTVEVIERRDTPRGAIQLQRRGGAYEIISNGTFLMATYNDRSARLLVTAALQVVDRPAHVLIGGLGAGISLGAALADRRVARVTVLEIEERIIAWNRTYLAPFSGHGLDDPRTRVVHGDLVAWLAATDEIFDTICLDVDNGPDWTIAEANLALYDLGGLQTVRRRLRPGGAVSVWSAAPSPAFATRLSQTFRHVQVIADAQARGVPDYVYLAFDGR